jgi:periplasmic protein CpxP/Spy
MKKVSAFMAIMLAILAFSANAQQGSAGMQQAFKQRLIDSLKFTPVQADSVVAVQQQFMPQMRAIRIDQSLSDADKKQKMMAIRDEEKARFAKFLTPDQIQKMEIMQQSMHPQMHMMKATNNPGASPAPGGN